MEPSLAINLASFSFWLFAIAAVLLLAPVAGAELHKAIRAGLNLLFLIWLTGPWAAGTLLLGVLLLYGAIRLRSRRARWSGLAGAGLSLLLLFLVHKLSPPWPESAGIKAVLGAVGFSYVALRVVELLRASAEGKTEGDSPLDVFNYLLPFHMLAAGPIQSYDEFRAANVAPPRQSKEEVLVAVERIARGLFKKFVLARLLLELFLTDFRAGGIAFFLEVQLYYVWVYLDFSAYSDIAVGIGRLLGVPAPENFDNPLAARNIIVFWERWHISLSQFIRRNLFIPLYLAGMRRTDGRCPLLLASGAFTVAFLFCGLWHGITLRFFLWGAMHAGALVICNLYRHQLQCRLGRKGVATYLKQPLVRAAATGLTFEFVAFSLAFVAPPLMTLWGIRR